MYFYIYKQNHKIHKEALLGVLFPKSRNVPLTALWVRYAQFLMWMLHNDDNSAKVRLMLSFGGI